MYSLIDFFEDWDISEEEMDECINYIREKLEVDI